MIYVIKSKTNPPEFYTGEGWEADLGKAKPYKTLLGATQAIAVHNMNAEPIEAPDENEQSRPTGTPQATTGTPPKVK